MLMNTYSYSTNNNHKKQRTSRKIFFLFFVIVIVLAVWWVVANNKTPKTLIVDSSKPTYSDRLSPTEIQLLESKIKNDLSGPIDVTTTTIKNDDDLVVDVYVPVTAFKSAKQNISLSDFTETSFYFLRGTTDTIKDQIATTLGSRATTNTVDSLDDIDQTMIVFVPITKLTHTVKLLALDGMYYLDTLNSGAIFRTVKGSGLTAALQNVVFELPQKDTILTINQTGVTALTRVMTQKLNNVGDAHYFSKNIGSFLASTDITHVSNEVSFMKDCPYSHTAFCSDYRFIETLKSSGVDVVELTGNHNNDLGSQNNTDTINLYHSLGWGTFGGGLNMDEARKPYEIDKKSTKIAMIGYNYADAPASGAIAGTSKAGANPYNAERLKSDISAAKDKGMFVIVDVQFWECYAYPDGYIEFPECDLPIGQQESVFTSIIDAGADMVVGTQAHQPQTYELYKGKSIYYGLGNLYFDQSYWPGTERGIVLTHYFSRGTLLQTKLTPTVYHEELQTRTMSTEEQEAFLSRFSNL